MSIAASPAQADLVWVGTEPSEIWYSANGGEAWEQAYFARDAAVVARVVVPTQAGTHHVRWIACHPRDSGRLWVAIEAGALVSTRDGGRTWHDRVSGGPWDTHELAIHPDAPTSLRVAAGDGYFESDDGGDRWRSPEQGLDVRYLRSVAIDPGRSDVVIVSASTGPRSAYVARRVRRTIVSPREERSVATSDDRLARSAVHDRAAARRGRCGGRELLGRRRARHTSVGRWRSAVGGRWKQGMRELQINLRGLSVLR